MAKNKLLNAESGIAHVGLILVVMLVLGLTGFAAYKVVTSNQVAQEQDDTSQLAQDEDPIDDESVLGDGEENESTQEEGVEDGDI